MSVREELQEPFDEPLLFADGFDDCIIGISDDFGKLRVVYSVEKMIESLMSSGDTYLDAIDWLEFNTLNTWVGENTPIYVESGT
tara:strand:+ start:4613 stop:4864 length:252 start_codon:yes stop_codon:yes gene_type:complete